MLCYLLMSRGKPNDLVESGFELHGGFGPSKCGCSVTIMHGGERLWERGADQSLPVISPWILPRMIEWGM